MIRHIEGFDLFAFTASGVPYVINSGIFSQGAMLTGQHFAGQSWWIFNTASGEADYEKLLDSQPTWIINFWFRPLRQGSDPQPQIWADSVFYRVSDSMGVLFDLRQRTDGTVDFRGAAATVLEVLGPFPVGVWAALQIKLTAGAYTIRVNGAEVATGVPLVWRTPDRFMHRWQTGNPGLNLDNYVICDGQGSLNNDFLPYPWRVDSVYPTATVLNEWTATGQSDALKCVYDRLGNPPPGSFGYPDGEKGYLEPTGVDQRALFQLTESPCVGRVLGLALSVVAKPVTGSPTVRLVTLQDSGLTELAQPTLVTRAVSLPGLPWLDDYFTYEGISETDPETGVYWTDGAINRAAWGVKSDSVDAHVTQIFVQRVATTANLSYDCGAVGNYIF
jgi:hypothetical protein